MKNLFVLIILLLVASALPAAAAESFVIYYSNTLATEKFDPFHLIVFDKDEHIPLAPLKEKGKQLLCYLSLGEVESRHAYTERLKQAGVLVAENKNWAKSYMVDLRNPLWQRMVIDTIIPSILEDGFHGVFLDTLDDPIELERTHPDKFKGMTQAAANLVKAIHDKYPNMPIMMNRAYELLPQVANLITMQLGESVYTDYNFTKKTYVRVKNDDYAAQVQTLKDARKANPHLQVYTLDYWNMDDHAGISRIYKQERANGFIPYVSTVALDHVIYEPDAQ